MYIRTQRALAVGVSAENEEVVMMLDLGYGKQKETLPNHHLRKELDETVKYL